MAVSCMNIKISKLRNFKYSTPEKLVVDTVPGNIGLKQLRDSRAQTTARWKKMGLLDGLTGNIKDNTAKLFESSLSYKFP